MKNKLLLWPVICVLMVALIGRERIRFKCKTYTEPIRRRKCPINPKTAQRVKPQANPNRFAFLHVATALSYADPLLRGLSPNVAKQAVQKHRAQRAPAKIARGSGAWSEGKRLYKTARMAYNRGKAKPPETIGSRICQNQRRGCRKILKGERKLVWRK